MARRASNYDGLKFAKAKQTGSMTAKEFQGAATNEDDLQRMCEEYLKLRGYTLPGEIEKKKGKGTLRGIYFHIPNEVFTRKKTTVNRNLKNLPDLVILDLTGRYLSPELKSRKGDMTRGQRAVSKIIPMPETRSFESFQELVDNFIERGNDG